MNQRWREIKMFKAILWGIFLDLAVSGGALALTAALHLSAFSEDVPAGIVVAYGLNLPGALIVWLLVWLLVPEPSSKEAVGPMLLLVVVFSGAFYGWLWHMINKGRRSAALRYGLLLLLC